MTKIDLVYGSLGAGTDPARLAVDGVEAIRLAATVQHAVTTSRATMSSAVCRRGRPSPDC